MLPRKLRTFMSVFFRSVEHRRAPVTTSVLGFHVLLIFCLHQTTSQCYNGLLLPLTRTTSSVSSSTQGHILAENLLLCLLQHQSKYQHPQRETSFIQPAKPSHLWQTPLTWFRSTIGPHWKLQNPLYSSNPETDHSSTFTRKTRFVHPHHHSWVPSHKRYVSKDLQDYLVTKIFRIAGGTDSLNEGSRHLKDKTGTLISKKRWGKYRRTVQGGDENGVQMRHETHAFRQGPKQFEIPLQSAHWWDVPFLPRDSVGPLAPAETESSIQPRNSASKPSGRETTVMDQYLQFSQIFYGGRNHFTGDDKICSHFSGVPCRTDIDTYGRGEKVIRQRDGRSMTEENKWAQRRTNNRRSTTRYPPYLLGGAMG